VLNTVLITGASGGIGQALALEYAAPGRTLFLHGRDVRRLTALSQECRVRGATVTEVIQDLREVKEWIARLEAVSRETPIDLAIVNAGVTNIAGLQGEEWEDIEQVLAVNIVAPLATVSGLLPAMRSRGQGQIALVSSLSAWYGMPVNPTYCASKAALKNYGEALRSLLAPQGIFVNVVLPGFVDTPMTDQVPGPKPFLMSPARAARLIRRGLDRNQGRIGFPLLLSWGMRCLSVLPPAVSERIIRSLGYTE